MGESLRRRDGILAARTGETIFPWFGPTFRFGVGATREAGFECCRLGMTRVLVVTDENVAATGALDDLRRTLLADGLQVDVWAGSQAEPTDVSIEAAVREVSGLAFDGLIGLGGGSSIDTCKLINLLTTHGGALRDYVSAPHGAGRAVPGPLAPMVGIPTTAGTGSECTALAVVDLTETHVKAAVSHYSMRPAVAIIDPLNSLSCPPAVTASGGYDAVVQALESLTSLACADRPPATSPGQRPVYVGHNPISSMWCEQAVSYAGRFLQRAVEDGDDLEAREGMCLAALCSRLGNAGVHIPHANAYAVAGTAVGYRPSGFTVDRPLVPHGESVIATAPAAFDATYVAAPARFDRAAELLGLPEQRRRDAPTTAVGDWLRDLVAATDGPVSLERFGLTPDQIPAMVDKAMAQQRVLVCAPLEVTTEVLTGVFERSFAPA
nr:alcohol dehydrogenase [Aeromicrobium sp.]